jgi:hypothetical protein
VCRAVVAPVRLRNITAADVMAQDCTSCSWHAATNNGAMQQVRKLEETVQRLLAEVLTHSPAVRSHCAALLTPTKRRRL